MIDIDVNQLGYKYTGVTARNFADEVIRCAKVGRDEGLEINIIVDSERRHSSKRGSYVRAFEREKNNLKSIELEVQLSTCLQEGSDKETASKLSKILQTK